MRSVLVANRGEIAVRIMRTLRRLGIESVAVYADDDAAARHVTDADVAIALGPGPASDTYLSVPRILDAVAASGADAVHPGYGFLSENADFARAVIDAGVTWIGPPPAAIESMGDKIRAKATVAAAGVPVVPGRVEPDLDDDALAAAALEIGLPVLVKPSAGGGGKGMHRVEEAGALPAAITAARREARASFGDDTLLVERWVTRPRHVEVQVFADTHGAVVHLGERECSLQRRHQKIIEEAPSPLIDQATRDRLGASAVDAARACGYVGAGTVEFIVSADRPDEYFFLEMNTRLQVEHPVTEAVTGLDLVEAQLRVAAGDRLPFGQEAAAASGHAVEARIYAEDPERGFLPSSGVALAVREPAGPGIRVDSSLAPGSVIGTGYDPLLAKVIAWGETRDQARRRLVGALAATTVLGVTTNIGFLQDLLAVPDVVSGAIDTELVERVLPDLTGAGSEAGDTAAAAALAAAAVWALRAEPSPLPGAIVDPWDVPGGWRLGGRAPTILRFVVGGNATEVELTGRAADAHATVEGAAPVHLQARWLDGSPDDGRLVLSVDGRTTTWSWVDRGDEQWLGGGGRSWPVRPVPLVVGTDATAPGAGPVTSPMPGTVLAVLVAVGDEVEAGAPLVVVEAMKMEHTVTAPVAGTVGEVRVTEGQAVKLDEVLAVVTAAPGEAPGGASDDRGGRRP